MIKMCKRIRIKIKCEKYIDGKYQSKSIIEKYRDNMEYEYKNI